jgi:hypothetical protein
MIRRINNYRLPSPSLSNVVGRDELAAMLGDARRIPRL